MFYLPVLPPSSSASALTSFAFEHTYCIEMSVGVLLCVRWETYSSCVAHSRLRKAKVLCDGLLL